VFENIAGSQNRRVSAMRLIRACIIGASILAVSATSSQAGFLLNCRLMQRSSNLYEWLCQGDSGNSYLLAEKCSERKLCIIKKQNFKGPYTSLESALGEIISEAAGTVGETGNATESETGLAVDDVNRGALTPKNGFTR
jgi:hypothetical protein